MRIKSLVVLSGLISSALIFGCNNSSQKNKEQDPSLILKDTAAYTDVQFIDSMQNFGTVKKGKLVDLKYTVKNVGEYPLYIVSVQPSCGCTVADYTKGAILPHKDGYITAKFDSNHGVAGSVHKSIIVSTNAKNKSNFVLAFEGKVVD